MRHDHLQLPGALKNRHPEYAATLEFLFSQLPMFQREGPTAFKKDLTNIHALLDHLGRPERAFPSIHIAGTNGKGSVAHMLAAVMQARGLRVGLYTSPHYLDFRERIKINGEYIGQQEVVQFVRDLDEAIARIRPSFFEITVAMAFWYFARQAVDLAVIETGLGGRLDSTNVLFPLLSVITNISYDHQQFLGDTLPEIAGEKAGIIKAGVPVVIGETHPETHPVFDRRAEALQAPISYADAHFRASLVEESFQHSLYRIEKNDRPFLEALRLDIAGPYQHLNLQTVLQALFALPREWQPGETALREGLGHIRERTRFLGRWQILGEHPLVLCDSAHNPGGIRPVVDRLLGMPFHRLHIVLGALKDKPLDELLALFPERARYYFCRPDIPRGLDAEALRNRAEAAGLRGSAHTGVPQAFAAACAEAGPEDIVFVGGSIFVVAEVLAAHQKEEDLRRGT